VLSRNTVDVRPTLGALKNLRPTHQSGLYGALLRDANLAARTVGLVHRALGHATGWDSAEYRGTSGPSPRCASRNSNSDSGPVNGVLETARGRAIFPIATLALAAGMRRGEGLS
jgi:hypothetical protein